MKSGSNWAGISGAIWEQGAPMIKVSGIHNDAAVISDYTLLSVYPNPFNAVSIINYTLAKKSVTEISIYNLTGCHIVTLLNQNQAAGHYSLIWDGTNYAHDPISSGIYFCTLKTENDFISEKIVLLK